MMTPIEWILSLSGGLITVFVGSFISHHSGKIKEIESKIDNSLSKADIRDLIEDIIKPVEVKVNETDRKVDLLLREKFKPYAS